MRSGVLNKSITIEQVTETQDSFGDPVKVWATFKIVRASVEPVSAKEYFNAQKQNTSQNVKFKIRYISGVTEKMRILFNGNYYDIESVINYMEKNREITIIGIKRA